MWPEKIREIRQLHATSALPAKDTTSRRDIHAFVKRLRPWDAGIPLIRLGGDGDGGYLVPDDLQGIRSCFSPGVGKISGFENDCSRLGMDVFLADRSVEDTFKGQDGFHFIQKYIGITDNEDFMTMEQWVLSYDPDGSSDLLLQMDIEGAEFDVIPQMQTALLRRFRIIVIEVHSFDLLGVPEFHEQADLLFRKLLSGHICVHIHPNNVRPVYHIQGMQIPRVMEFTFLRKDRVRKMRHATHFPHPLDRDNVAKPPVELPECWYRPISPMRRMIDKAVKKLFPVTRG